jgi:hypothetical protein
MNVEGAAIVRQPWGEKKPGTWAGLNPLQGPPEMTRAGLGLSAPNVGRIPAALSALAHTMLLFPQMPRPGPFEGCRTWLVARGFA